MTRVVSVGFKHGAPVNPHSIIMDVRTWIRNPWKVPALRPLTGLDPRVGLYLAEDPNTEIAMISLFRAIEKGPQTLYIGCQGGKHRSVYLADRLGRALPLLNLKIEHRDLEIVEGGE